MTATIAIRDLAPRELKAAAVVLGRGMINNPLHVAAFGSRPSHREAALARFFLPVLRVIAAKGRILGAWRDDTLVGVCAMTPPGRCRPTVIEKLRIVPAIAIGNPLRTVRAVLDWTGAWARHDPDEPHWHLGPVAVDHDLQRQGIGGRLLTEFCRATEAGTNANAPSLSYLETDKRENVLFYEKHGFVVTGNELILRVPNWYMERRPPER